MSLLRNNFRVDLADKYLDNLLLNKVSFYYFLGRSIPWENDSIPPENPENTLEKDLEIRDNIAYVKKVSSVDGSLAVRRNDWISGQVYDKWDHTRDMREFPFYVMTDEFNVYKCLNNNQGAVSVDKPVGNTIFPITTSDGYVWKYMYNIPTFKRIKFISDKYIPVQRALSDSFYNRGSIEEVTVENGGSGYIDNKLTNIQITGTTTGTDATAEITQVGALGQILEITILTPGSDYTKGANISITSVGGSGANVSAIFTAGALSGFVINDPGFGYIVGNEVLIQVGGASLIPIISRDTGSIVDVVIESAGAGYTSAPTLSLIQFPVTGTGKYDNPDAILTAVEFEGSIVRVLIQDPGINYPVDTSTSIIVTGDGTGASFTPVIIDGEFTALIVDNPGINYTFINLQILGEGTGAVLTPLLTQSDFVSDQSIIEQTAVDGAIHAIDIVDGGSGYTSSATVDIFGDGTGAQASLVRGAGGVIENIIVTDFGQGYTRANINIIDPQRITSGNTEFSAYAILSPSGGHGKDAPQELYGDICGIFSQLRSDLELIELAQEYRQYGLLVNLTDLFTSRRITDQSAQLTFELLVSGNLGDLEPDDELIESNGVAYRVLQVKVNSIIVIQQSSIFRQPAGTLTLTRNTSTTFSIQSVLSFPRANKYSGNLLYTSNSIPFEPSNEQTITARTYIEF